MHQSRRQADALKHPLGQGARGAVHGRRHPHAFDDVNDALTQVRAAKA